MSKLVVPGYFDRWVLDDKLLYKPFHCQKLRWCAGILWCYTINSQTSGINNMNTHGIDALCPICDFPRIYLVVIIVGYKLLNLSITMKQMGITYLFPSSSLRGRVQMPVTDLIG